jgi:hypothetical protein
VLPIRCRLVSYHVINGPIVSQSNHASLVLYVVRVPDEKHIVIKTMPDYTLFVFAEACRSTVRASLRSFYRPLRYGYDAEAKGNGEEKQKL